MIVNQQGAPVTLVFSNDAIKQHISMEEGIHAVEESFRGHGRGEVANLSTSLKTRDSWKNAIHIKVGYLVSSQYSALKTSGILIFSQSGIRKPLAIMDSAQITWLRTGAAGAVAAKYLARKDSRSIAVIGTGKQGRSQLLGLTKVL